VGGLNEWLGSRLFMPSSLVVFLAGVFLVIDGPWSFDQLWIDIGLFGYGATFLTHVLLRQSELRRMKRANALYGPGNPEAARRVRRIILLGRVDLAMLFLVALDMVLKPGTEDAGLLAGGGAALALAVAAALFTLRPRTAGAHAAEAVAGSR